MDESFFIGAMKAIGIKPIIIDEKTKFPAKGIRYVTCNLCKGTGFNLQHKWPDGSFASCTQCEGTGETEVK